MDKKTTGIVAYITWIGWIIAYFAGDKEGAKFHLNQALVIWLASILSGIIMNVPFLGSIVGSVLSIFALVCWILGLIAACKGEEKEVPLLGQIRLLK